MSVFKQKGRKTYEYEFQIKGKLFRGNTGQLTKAEASQEEIRLRKEARSLLKKNNTNDMTLEMASILYWENIGKHRKRPKEIANHLANVQRIIGPTTLIKDIDAAIVEEFVASRRAEKNLNYKDRKNAPFVSHAAVNRDLAYLSAVLNRARDIDKAVVQHISFGDAALIEPDSRRYILSVEEEENIINQLVPHSIPLIAFMFLVGQRKANCRQLDWSQVFFDKRQIVFRVKSKKPEGRKITLPINDEMMQLLLNLGPKSKGPVFTFGQNGCTCWHCETKKGDPIRSIDTTWKGAVRRAGIYHKVRIHDIRHTTATRLLKRSRDLRLTQQYIGHADIKTTMRYAEYEEDEMMAGMNFLSEIPNKIPNTQNKKKLSN